MKPRAVQQEVRLASNPVTYVDMISTGLLSLFAIASAVLYLIWRRRSTAFLAGGLWAFAIVDALWEWLRYSNATTPEIDNVLTFLHFVSGVAAGIGAAWSSAELHQARLTREPKSTPARRPQ